MSNVEPTPEQVLAIEAAMERRNKAVQAWDEAGLVIDNFLRTNTLGMEARLIGIQTQLVEAGLIDEWELEVFRNNHLSELLETNIERAKEMMKEVRMQQIKAGGKMDIPRNRKH